MRRTKASSPTDFELGGKNHLGSALQMIIKSYRELLKGYPKNFSTLASFLKELKEFIVNEKRSLMDKCAENGWPHAGERNYKAEIDRAEKALSQFLNNPQENESPLFIINEALEQLHIYLINFHP